MKKNRTKTKYIYDLPDNALLTFKDNDCITAYYKKDGVVLFDGELMSLSKAANKAAKKNGTLNKSGSYQGSVWWKYNGKLVEEYKKFKEEETIMEKTEQTKTEPIITLTFTQLMQLIGAIRGESWASKPWFLNDTPTVYKNSLEAAVNEPKKGTTYKRPERWENVLEDILKEAK